jgi:hypothetical protein
MGSSEENSLHKKGILWDEIIIHPIFYSSTGFFRFEDEK